MHNDCYVALERIFTFSNVPSCLGHENQSARAVFESRFEDIVLTVKSYAMIYVQRLSHVGYSEKLYYTGFNEIQFVHLYFLYLY